MDDHLITVDGVASLVADLDEIARNAQPDLTDHLSEHASVQETKARARARARGGVARVAGRSVRSTSTNVGGTITGGGSGRLPSGTGTYGDIFFGSEFGGGSRPRTRQFKPYRPSGYWFFGDIDRADEELPEQLADQVIERLED